MKKHSQLQLVGLAVGGDLDALDELLRLHKAAVMAKAGRKGLSGEAPDEIWSEVCIRVIENIARLEKATAFRSWLLTIADHVIADEITAVRKTSDIKLPPDVLEQMRDDSVPDRPEFRHIALLVREIIDSCYPADRDLIYQYLLRENRLWDPPSPALAIRIRRLIPAITRKVRAALRNRPDLQRFGKL